MSYKAAIYEASHKSVTDFMCQFKSIALPPFKPWASFNEPTPPLKGIYAYAEFKNGAPSGPANVLIKELFYPGVSMNQTEGMRQRKTRFLEVFHNGEQYQRNHAGAARASYQGIKLKHMYFTYLPCDDAIALSLMEKALMMQYKRKFNRLPSCITDPMK